MQRWLNVSTAGGPFRTARLEAALWCAGILGTAYCATVGVEMLSARQSAMHVSAQVGSGSTTEMGENDAESFAGTAKAPKPQVVGRLEIPALGMMTPLLAGDDSMSLSEGAGHIPGTALPGGLGTVGISGHRDTHFRALSRVAPGMEVLLVSREGVYHYRVTSSEIVWPDQVEVLATGSEPGLVLVTCYPFRFIGHSPKRFIVHATLASVIPDGG